MNLSIQAELHLASKRHLKERKKRSWSTTSSLSLAAELLSVDCGLKPCFLYDYSGVRVHQIQSYLQELQRIGFIKGHMHTLNIADNILIINVPKTMLYLDSLLHSEDLHVMDVSASLDQPAMLSCNHVSVIRTQVTQLLDHLTPYQNEQPATVSLSDIESPQWNLCTIFGFILHFPAVYWFDTSSGFENCLSMMPLRHFTVQASCSTIGLTKAQIYSFSIPDSVYDCLQKHLQEWIDTLKQKFLGQSDFTDLKIAVNTVTLKAVTL
ncbi:UPF0739 protein C1orf74 homolog [Pelobates fuscus]|uniref:UPF0739 protein C1orf74 homolog n=1 Tax=Pelobates fuscus TaxID=191477 RepID=UPI002FE4C352